MMAVMGKERGGDENSSSKGKGGMKDRRYREKRRGGAEVRWAVCNGRRAVGVVCAWDDGGRGSEGREYARPLAIESLSRLFAQKRRRAEKGRWNGGRGRHDARVAGSKNRYVPVLLYTCSKMRASEMRMYRPKRRGRRVFLC